MSKLKKNFTTATNRIDPASTNSKDFGFDVATKGGKTLNASIDPHSFEKELKDLAREDYTPEHERYLGVGMETVG